MATPTFVRAVPTAPTTKPAAGVATAVGWATAPTAGRRGLLFISHNDNGVVAHETVVGSGWTLLNPPGIINRINNELVLVYEKLSLAGTLAADDVTLAFDQSVFWVATLVEVASANSTIPTDVTGSNAGSAQTLSAGATSTSSRDDVLYLSAFASGNIHAHSNPLPTGFTLDDDSGSSGASDATKITMAITHKAAGTHPESVTPTVDVAGGFNHNYAALTVGIPGSGTGTVTNPGTAFNLPDTTDGLVHRLCSLHYYPGGVKPSGATDAQATANAQKLAGLVDIVVGNVIEAAATQAITTDKFQGKTAAMIAVKPNILLMPYNKSAEIDEGATYFPNDYYAHITSWPNGPKQNVYSGNVYIAQPDYAAGASAYVDPRGWTAHSFREQRARDAWARVARYNVLHGANNLRGAYLDTMNVFNVNLIDPDTGVAYGNANKQKFIDLVWAIGDETITRRPGSTYAVFGNGMGNGMYYNSNGKLQIAHLDGGLAEFYLRINYDLPTAFYTEAQWQLHVDMVYDMNIVKSKVAMLVTNINNSVAGAFANGTPSVFSAAQLAQWRRYTIGTHMLAKRNSTFMEFVESVSVSPWNEDHPWYYIDLGAPLETFNSGAQYQRPPIAGQTVGIYRRQYANGVVYVNPTPNPIIHTVARDYKNVPGDPVKTYATGSNVTIPAHDALILYTASVTTANAEAPITAFVGPATSVNQANQVASATASDPDGVATAEFNLNGGLWQAATLSGGVWTHPFTLVSGANSIGFRATDANASPLTSSPIFRTVTYTPNAGPPTVTINNPATTIGTTTALAQVTAADSDGIASVEISLNDTASWVPAVFNGGTGKWELTLTFKQRANTMYARATDSHPEPQTSAIVSRAITDTLFGAVTPSGGTTGHKKHKNYYFGGMAERIAEDISPVDFE